MKTLKWSDINVNMPAVDGFSNTNNAGWWASYLLQLGDKGEYDLLMYYLGEARANGCLSIVRLATQQLVQERVRQRQKSGPSVRKVSRKSGSSFKAVKAVA